VPATLADIARKTGFAMGSVADVLRGRPGYSASTRQIILEAARQLDFVPNHLGRSLKKRRSSTIGVAASLDNSGVTGPMLHAVAQSLWAGGYMPLFADTSAHEDGAHGRAIRELRARSVDGIIIHGDYDDATVSQMVPPSVPVVMIRGVDQPGRPCVVSDRREAYRFGVRWFAQRGHRRIAFVGGDYASVMAHPFNTHRLKIEGYSSAMQELGLADPALLISVPTTPGQVRRFLNEHPEAFSEVTAVLAGNDRLAAELISGLSDLGRSVPGDVSVIGFDNTEFTEAVKPRISSFDPRRAQVGRVAVQLMMELLDGRVPQSVHVAPELVERDSTASERRPRGTKRSL
jgi:LacI family transcriptional regulator